MPNLLAPSDLRKLVGILGMLGSSHDGERASAGLLATRLLQERGLTWSRLLMSERISEAPPRTQDWRAEVIICLQCSGLLTEWERHFLIDISAMRRAPTPKQRAIITDIAQQLRSRRAA